MRWSRVNVWLGQKSPRDDREHRVNDREDEERPRKRTAHRNCAQDDGYKYDPVQDRSGDKLAATRTATEEVEPADDRQQHTHDSDKRSLMTCERRLPVDDLKYVRPE